MIFHLHSILHQRMVSFCTNSLHTSPQTIHNHTHFYQMQAHMGQKLSKVLVNRQRSRSYKAGIIHIVYSHKVNCLVLLSIYLNGPKEVIKTNGNFKPTAPRDYVFHSWYLEKIYMSIHKLFFTSISTSFYREILFALSQLTPIVFCIKTKGML